MVIKMKLKILSDLHIEICDYLDEPSAEPTILVLAGDIGYFLNETIYINFLNELSFNYDYVLCIAGNHEYYFAHIDYDISNIERKLHTNIKIINNKTFFYKNYKFIGSTLWTSFNDDDFFAKIIAKKNMQDYRLIHEKSGGKLISPEVIYDKFIKNIDFIKDEIDPNYENIIITHHAPSIKSVPEKYRTESNKYLNHSYYTDLEKFIFENENNIKYWIHGHSHDSSDYNIGNTRIISNPRGYAKLKNDEFIVENKNFNYNFLLDLD